MRHDMGYFEEKQLGKQYDIRLLKRILPFAFPYKGMLLISIFLVMLITLLDLAIPYVTKVAIDQYIVPKMDATIPDENRSNEKNARSRYLEVTVDNQGIQAIIDKHAERFQRKGQIYIISYRHLSELESEDIAVLRKQHLSGVSKIAGLFMVIVVLNFAFNFLQKIVMEYTGHMMMNDLRLNLFDHIQHLSMPFFTRNPVGRLVTRVTNDVQNMHELFTSVISLVFKDLFLLVGIAAVLVFMNWKLALVSFLILPLVGYTSLAFSGRIREAFRVLRIKVAEINTTFAEMIDGVSVIQSFGTEKVAADHFSRLNHENYLAGMRQINVLAVFMPLIEVVGIATVSVIIFSVCTNVLDGHISLGVLVAFISYMRMFFRPIRDLAEKYNILQNALASAERIFLIFDTDNTIDAAKDGSQAVPSESDSDHSTAIRSMALENVSFSYLPSEPVLHGISLNIRAGDTVAIIGPTGSGKTSIANLIMRFYTPDAGRILLNGSDMKDISTAWHRSKIALVTQEPYLFSESIYANIWRGRQHVDPEEIARILEASNCSALVERQPEGLQTLLTRGGAALSSGERQLISIARAFARDPELILLDEATSYVDSLTEDMIQDALSKLMTSRTSIIIAHRLSTVRHADIIVVIEKGRILEKGDHDTLMAQKGFYFRMNHLQHCLGNTC